MTDSQACQVLADRLEALLAGQRCPVRVRCEPYGAHGYQVTAAGRVPVELGYLAELATGAARVTIQYSGNLSLITLE